MLKKLIETKSKVLPVSLIVAGIFSILLARPIFGQLFFTIAKGPTRDYNHALDLSSRSMIAYGVGFGHILGTLLILAGLIVLVLRFKR